jgi:hypothetical protein
MEQFAIVVHKTSRVPYKFLGGNIFQNMQTLVTGEVDNEMAQKIFNVNLSLTWMINDFPNVALLIQKLNLKIER